MNKEQLLYMNFWTPNWDAWGNGLDPSQMPFYTRYDYVEAYDYNEQTAQFDLRFRDDFDTLDRNIWRVSNEWTFPENDSIFMENHTFVEDGKHILKWLTGRDYEEFKKGSKIKLSGVVKAHNTTAYYGDETTLRSCKLIRDIENA